MRGRGNLTRWLQADPRKHVGVPIAALVLGATGMFGGLDPVPLADRLDEVQPGAEVTAQPFELTLKHAVAVDQIDGVGRPLTAGNHLLLVLLDVVNVSTESVGSHFLIPVSRTKSYLNRVLVVLDDRLAPWSATVYDADANIPVAQLSPGLSYRLALVWEFQGPVPSQLPLGLAELTRRGTTISPDDLEWQDPEEAATATLPVWDRTRGSA